MELVSFEKLKGFLALSEDNISEYGRLQIIKEHVESAIEGYLNRVLEKDKYTQDISLPYSTHIINLDALPVESVEYLGYKPDFSDEFIEFTGFVIRDYGLLLRIPLEKCAIRVTYTGGLEDVPKELERAALLQIAYEFQNSPRVGVKSISTDGGTVSTEGYVLLSEVIRLLDKHKHPGALL